MEKYKNNEAIYQILCLIDHHYELGTNPNFLDDPTLKKLKISSKRLNLILGGLLNAGYIEGIPVMSSIREIKEPIGITHPNLTIAGMNYLVDNSSMKKAVESLKFLSDIIPW